MQPSDHSESNYNATYFELAQRSANGTRMPLTLRGLLNGIRRGLIAPEEDEQPATANEMVEPHSF